MFGLLGAPSTLETGLLHLWSLEGNSNDALGTGNGTDTAVTYVAGKLGQCASFNGTTSKIVTASSGPLGAASWSVSMWLYATTYVSYNAPITWGSGAGTQVRFYWDGTSLGISNGAAIGATKALSANTWHHVVATYNGTTSVLYIDSSPSTPVAWTLNTNATPISIGAYTSPAYTWNGLIDEVVMANRAWTPGEVALLYANGSPGRCPW